MAAPASVCDSLVSVGLPVRNGGATLESAIKSVLTQDHERLELVISDNASTDDTETICRDLAASDSRVRYHRQERNIGLVANIAQTIHLANGAFFRWISDDDWLAPQYVSSCLKAFSNDSRLILVTTQINYIKPDGTTHTRLYSGTSLSSNDPIERFYAVTSYLVDGMPVDPLYGLMRKAKVISIGRTRGKMIREDAVFATQLALIGPWGHVPELLANRHLGCERLPVLARRLGVPVWQAYMPFYLQCRETLRCIETGNYTPAQRRKARFAVGRMYMRLHYDKVSYRMRKLAQIFAAV
ncbi:MAG: glycosyltransferase family 2 protein [Nitrospira sp.]|nr:glycosyltransferase family 2 protein [Nitrospira sp.]MBS1734439.1 glycosyltransferase family 2 protein [Bacteroidota bacterium]MBX3338074.1 glycosyltransferase family 2 protein [Nitrospira sp.]MCW5780428.1 glycosyltransferase family 2 protein [Nitrospira sp.]